MKLLNSIIATTFAATLLTACDRAKQAGDAFGSINSPWELKDTKDKMTDARIISAELQQKSEEFPLITINAKVTCQPDTDESGFFVELTTLSSNESQGGTLKGMPIEFLKNPPGLDALVKIQFIASGLMPAGFPYKRHTTVALKINEGQPDTQLIPDALAVSSQYNNQIFVFPLQIEALTKTPIDSARIEIPTTQGNPNILIDFKDPNVAKVVGACDGMRRALKKKTEAANNAASKPTEQPSIPQPNDANEPQRASPPAPLAPASPTAPPSSGPRVEAAASSADSKTNELINTKPSFDCTKASNNVEQRVCSNETLARLDAKLNLVFNEAKKRTEDIHPIKIEQIAWIKNQRNKCTSDECIKEAYDFRINQIESLTR